MGTTKLVRPMPTTDMSRARFGQADARAFHDESLITWAGQKEMNWLKNGNNEGFCFNHLLILLEIVAQETTEQKHQKM